METQTEASRPARALPGAERHQVTNSNLVNALEVERLSENLRGLVMVRYADLGSGFHWHHARFRLKSLIRVLGDLSADFGKRLIDLIGAALLLLLLAPLFLLLAILIRLESKGPVFFRQTRVGKWGSRFTIYKFRSMCADAERLKEELLEGNVMEGGVLFKMVCDPRVTRIGKIIRRGSLDELPQLWNVLRGEMSLVGPRPPLPSEVDSYSLGERLRLDVKPGITCIWQVSGRSQICFRQQVELDIAYIETQSFWGDIKLLLKTVPAVLTGRGAY